VTTLADPADRLAAILRRAGIRIVEDATLDCPGQVAVERGEYVIRVRPNLPSAHRLTVLQHELAHVLHGDLLTMQRERRDPQRWNLATDQRINATLDPVAVAELNGVTPASLREHGMLTRDLGAPRPAWSARIVYDAIDLGAGATFDGGEGFDSLTTDGTMTESAHAATVVRARGIARAEGATDLLPNGGDGGGILQGGDGSARRTWPTPRPEPSPAVAAILSRLAAVAGRADRRRTWRRPGRLPELRGSHYEPRLHVLAGLDVSGSTDSLLPTLGAVVAWLRRDPRWDVTCAVWADRAEIVSDLATAATVGYGTQVQPLFTLAATRGVDAIVVATDGVIADWYPAPAVPVVWAVAAPGDRRPPYGTVTYV
jgi:hypothetical protein